MCKVISFFFFNWMEPLNSSHTKKKFLMLCQILDFDRRKILTLQWLVLYIYIYISVAVALEGLPINFYTFCSIKFMIIWRRKQSDGDDFCLRPFIFSAISKNQLIISTSILFIIAFLSINCSWLFSARIMLVLTRVTKCFRSFYFSRVDSFDILISSIILLFWRSFITKFNPYFTRTTCPLIWVLRGLLLSDWAGWQ